MGPLTVESVTLSEHQKNAHLIAHCNHTHNLKCWNRSLTYDDRIHVTDRCVHLSVCTDVYISSQSDWLVGEVYGTVPLSLFCPLLEHYNSWPYIHNVRNVYTHSLGNKVEKRKKLSKFGQISSLCPSRIHLLYRLNSNLTSMNRASLLGNVPLCTKSTGMHT